MPSHDSHRTLSAESQSSSQQATAQLSQASSQTSEGQREALWKRVTQLVQRLDQVVVWVWCIAGLGVLAGVWLWWYATRASAWSVLLLGLLLVPSLYLGFVAMVLRQARAIPRALRNERDALLAQGAAGKAALAGLQDGKLDIFDIRRLLASLGALRRLAGLAKLLPSVSHYRRLVLLVNPLMLGLTGLALLAVLGLSVGAGITFLLWLR